MIPLAWAFAILALVLLPLAIIGWLGLRVSLHPTTNHMRAFVIALLMGPLLVPAWYCVTFLASIGCVPKPPLPDPGSGEAVMCVVLSIVLSFGLSVTFFSAFTSIRHRRRRKRMSQRLFGARTATE